MLEGMVEPAALEPVYALLIDGTTVSIREVLPGDLEAVRDMHRGMSPENLYLRFFGISPRAADEVAARLCREPGHDHAALGAWLAGNGCVPVFNLMEDAATAEIARSQVWQWMRSPKGVLEDGRKVTAELVRQIVAEELPRVRELLGEDAWQAGKYEAGARLFERITLAEAYPEFLTVPAYDSID